MSTAALCPICSKLVEAEYKPFCSKRCADIDLSRWLKGVYSIPGTTAPEEGENTDAEPPARKPN